MPGLANGAKWYARILKTSESPHRQVRQDIGDMLAGSGWNKWLLMFERVEMVQEAAAN